MSGLLQAAGPRWLRRTAAALLLLLAVRFFSDVTLAATGPDPATLATVSGILDALELALGLLLFAAVFLLFMPSETRIATSVWLSFLVLQAACFVVWVPYDSARDPTDVGRLFPWIAPVAVGAGSAFAAGAASGLRLLMKRWWGLAFLALLAVVPVAFALRTAAPLGLGTAPGPDDALRGNWPLVNAPTFALELVAIGTWLYIVAGLDRPTLRRRWKAFLPFLAVPLAAVLFATSRLAAFILAATISWGTNLAVFVPTFASLLLAVFSLACLASAYLLIPRRSDRDVWDLALLGALTVLLAGFFPSMVSVGGLTFGLLLIAHAVSLRTNAE